MKLYFLATLFVATAAFGQDRDSVFDEKIAPILKTACAPCHDDSTRSSGLSVLSKSGLMAGGARQGAAVTPGNPDQSVLLKMLRGQAAPRMPLNGQPLAAEKIEAIAGWVAGLEPETAAKTEQKWGGFEKPRETGPP